MTFCKENIEYFFAPLSPYYVSRAGDRDRSGNHLQNNQKNGSSPEMKSTMNTVTTFSIFLPVAAGKQV